METLHKTPYKFQVSLWEKAGLQIKKTYSRLVAMYLFKDRQISVCLCGWQMRDSWNNLGHKHSPFQKVFNSWRASRALLLLSITWNNLGSVFYVHRKTNWELWSLCFQLFQNHTGILMVKGLNNYLFLWNVMRIGSYLLTKKF